MSIFGKIIGAIFGSGAQAAPAGSGSSAPTGTSAPASGASPGTAGSSAQAGTAQAGSSASSTASGAAAGGASGEKVDVSKVLDDAVKAKGQKLEWRTSIVDLMKALDIDSSLSARKELAEELKYTGDTNDSATMNVWLHKQVIKKLEENGGKVPADLKD